MPTSLEILNMNQAGKFTGGIPAEWGSLTNLKELKMAACGLDGACLCCINSLREACLAYVIAHRAIADDASIARDPQLGR